MKQCARITAICFKSREYNEEMRKNGAIPGSRRDAPVTVHTASCTLLHGTVNSNYTVAASKRMFTDHEKGRMMDVKHKERRIKK